MQKGSFTEKSSRFDENGMVERINKFTSIFRKRNFLVIFINNKWKN